ncbi:hypothetical protein MN608_07374 [Microdochium nivale]|nr:hypothetical protein MN608_07374 [Microdochium nivale]
MEFVEQILAMDHTASIRALVSRVTSIPSLSSARLLMSSGPAMVIPSPSSLSSSRFDLDSATLDKVWIAILGIEAIMIAGLVLARLFHQCFRKQHHLEMYI